MKKTSLFLFIFAMSSILLSCKKANFNDHVGPSICPSKSFAYVDQPSINTTSINLATTTLEIRATFNEDVPWYITIKGLTSKSFKKYSGYGKTISLDWKGNPDTLAFFRVEDCEVEFKIACLDEVIIRPFTITTISNFSNQSYLVYNGDAGALGTGPFASGTYATHTVEAGSSSPQGGNCFCTVGSSPSLVWYFGGWDLNLALTNQLSSNAEQVYFNAFVNVSGSDISIPVVTFAEGGVQRSKSLLELSGKSGWQYVSFKLSEANVVNPLSITAISFGLNAYPTQATSGNMCVDFVLLSNDAPFIKK